MATVDKTDRRFLHGEDLQRGGKWSEFALTVERVGGRNSEKAQDGTVVAGVPLYFSETDKCLVLNSTNERLVNAMWGTDHAKWGGKKLSVYPVVGNWFRQQDVLAVRVRVPAGRPRPFIPPTRLGKDVTGKAVMA